MKPFMQADIAWDLQQQQQDDAQEPLLPKHHHAAGQRPSHQQDGQNKNPQQQHSRMPGSRQQQQQEGLSVDLGRRFLRRLWHLLTLINAAPALSLVLVSLAETLIVSKIGTISGLFYQVFVDGQASQVGQLMLWSAGCYTATALFFSFKAGLQDFFAWRWRASLTVHLQQAYCANIGATCARNKAPLMQLLDSPDQRVAQDLPLLTASLSEVLTQLAAVPFNIFWYTHLTRQVFGSWVPVLCAYAFFLTGLLLQRLVMLPVASAVFQQEAAEGAFRYAHTRFRAWAAEIAMYRSEPLEQQHLEGQLCRLLVCQGRLMLRRAVLTATSRLLEYGGLVVNFGCLAAAVFGGAWSGPGSSAGDIASKVSIASFYLLTLIYNFSQVLDLASKVANLAGLTARVCQMLEVLTGTDTDSTSLLHQQQQHSNPNTTSSSSSRRRGSKQPARSAPAGDASAAGALQTAGGTDHYDHHPQQQQQPLQELAAGKSPSHQRYASQAVLLQAPQLVLVPVPTAGDSAAGAAGSLLAAGNPAAAAAEPPGQQQQQQQQQQQGLLTYGKREGVAGPSHPSVMQVSIHSMGADMLLQEVRRAFPDSPRLAPLLAVVTFQFCGVARVRMLRKLLQQQGHTQQDWQQEQQQGCLGGQQLPTAGHQQHMGNNSSSSGSGVQRSCCSSCADSADGCEGTGSGCGSSSSSQGLCGDVDMQHMLAVFIAWQQAVHQHITSSGYWCDTVDPRTGSALHSTPGSHYDEVIGASVLLGYGQVTPPGQAFSLISHPDAATQVYPATLFTSAPLPVVREALQAAAALAPDTSPAAAGMPVATQQVQQGCPDSPQPRQHVGSTSSIKARRALAAPSNALQEDLGCALPLQPHHEHQHRQHRQQQRLLLSCSQLSVRTPAGVSVVLGLSLRVSAGQSLLIQGPSGCGKSTLIACLAGLWPQHAGNVSLGALGHAAAAAVGGVMFVPQRPLAAPGLTLRQQLLYPAAGSTYPCSCCAVVSSSGTGSDTGLQLQQQGRQHKHKPHQGSGSGSSSSGSSSWWLNWLSCGLHKQLQQQVQGAPGSFGTTGGAAAAAAGIKQQHYQLQVLLPVLPPAHTALCSLPPAHASHQHTQLQVSLPVQHQQQLAPLCPSCQHLLWVLDCVGLSYLLSTLPAGLHTRQDAWGDVLSPGELQRLSVARVLLHAPPLVVLDEATSALPDAAAVALYKQLQGAGITCVSVGHSRCLVGVHERVLVLAGDGCGDWCIS